MASAYEILEQIDVEIRTILEEQKWKEKVAEEHDILPDDLFGRQRGTSNNEESIQTNEPDGQRDPESEQHESQQDSSGRDTEGSPDNGQE